MPRISRRTFLSLAGAATVVCGCGGKAVIPGNGSSTLLAFSDIHFNPFYTKDSSVFTALNTADVSEWEGIFENSGSTVSSTWGADTTYPLLKQALASVRSNLGNSEVVIYTGDLLGHQIPSLYATASGIANPTNAAIAAFTNKTAQFVMQQIRAAVKSIPVVFALGNCDSYTGYGPDSTFLASTADTFYSSMLNGITDHQEFLTTFKSAGYYSVELFQKQLMVIGLNTILCSPLITPLPPASAVNPQFAWLDQQLARAQAAGQKVWIVMHVPVGGYLSATAASADSNGQIPSAQMMWVPAYQTSFLEIVAKYPGLISMLIAGHTHMDEYRLMMPGYALEIAPGISPLFGNDPAYKMFTLDLNTFIPGDYSVVKRSLAAASPSQFASYYTFTEAYGTPEYSTEYLEKLFPTLATDPVQQARFRQTTIQATIRATPSPTRHGRSTGAALGTCQSRESWRRRIPIDEGWRT